MKHTRHTAKRYHRTAVIGSCATLCALLSFVLGMQMSGTVPAFEHTQAALNISSSSGGAALRGDIDGDGVLSTVDALAILEFSEGLSEPTSTEIRQGDLDGDFRLTGKDVIRLLRIINQR